jgi:hypothetical protein
MSTKRASSLTKRMTPVQWIGVAEGGGGVFVENFSQDSQGAGVFFPAAKASGFGSVASVFFFEVAHPAIVRDTKRARKSRPLFKGAFGYDFFRRNESRWV